MVRVHTMHKNAQPHMHAAHVLYIKLCNNYYYYYYYYYNYYALLITSYDCITEYNFVREAAANSMHYAYMRDIKIVEKYYYSTTV